MNIRTFTYATSLVLLSIIILLLGSTQITKAAVDTCTWTGNGTGDYKNMHDAANWTGCDNSNVPENGDSLIFPDVSADKAKISFNATDWAQGSLQVDNVTFNATTNAVSYKVDGDGVLVVVGKLSHEAYLTLAINISLASDAIIESAPTTYHNLLITNSIADKTYLETPVRTFNIGNHKLTVNRSYLRVQSNIVGSGTLELLNDSTSLEGDNHAFTGSILNYASLNFSRTLAIAGNIENYQTSNISFSFSSDYKDNLDVIKNINNSITFKTDGNGNSGSTMSVSLPLSDTSGGKGAGGPETPTPTVIYPEDKNPYVVNFSNIVTQNNVRFNMYSTSHSTTNINGQNALFDKFTISDGSTGKTYINGQQLISKSRTNTYSKDVGSYEYAYDNQEYIVNVNHAGMVMYSGSRVKGTGNISFINQLGGILAPGLSPGTLNSGNYNTSGGEFEAEIGGTNPGEYDQLNVTGTVVLGTETILKTVHWNGYKPALNNQFIIINNDASDAVTGNFKDLPQGSTFAVDGYTYTVSYTGGDGNDVVLTATGVPADQVAATPNTGAIQKVAQPLIATLLSIIAISFVVFAVKANKENE